MSRKRPDCTEKIARTQAIRLEHQSGSMEERADTLVTCAFDCPIKPAATEWVVLCLDLVTPLWQQGCLPSNASNCRVAKLVALPDSTDILTLSSPAPELDEHRQADCG